MLQHLPFIWRNALRNKRRSVLTVASIAVSLCLLGLMITFYMLLLYGPSNQSPAQARRIVVHHKVSFTQMLPTWYRQRIAEVPGVVAISEYQWYGGTYKDARDARNFFAQLAVDPATVLTIYPDFPMPADQLKAFETTRASCIASTDLARRMGWKLGERIVLTGDLFPGTLDMKLVGLFVSPYRDEALLLPWKLVEENLPEDRQGEVGAYLLLVDKPADVARVSKTIDAMFANSPAPTKTESEMDFAMSFASFLGNLKVFFGSIAAAVTFTIVLVCANTVAMAVRERTRETAILRTLGFTPGEVTGFVLAEAGLLGLVGGVLGMGLDWLLRAVLNQTHVLGFLLPWPTVGVEALVLALGVVIGVGAAVLPAVWAGRGSVLEALRNVG